MDDNTTIDKRTNQRSFTWVAGGCLGILYLVLCVIVLIFGGTQISAKSSPTPTSTPIPIPHILVHQPTNKNTVIYEDFSSNQRNWGLYYDYGKIEVIDGKLALQVDSPNGVEIGTSRQLSISGQKYYIQADFTTDFDTPYAYGLVFGLNKYLSTYYVFELWPQSSVIHLLKANTGKWTELAPFTPIKTNDYPQVNTLSVYFAQGNIELYVNGELALTYFDKDYFQSKDFGLFVNNTGYRVIVDNLFIYNEK